MKSQFFSDAGWADRILHQVRVDLVPAVFGAISATGSWGDRLLGAFDGTGSWGQALGCV